MQRFPIRFAVLLAMLSPLPAGAQTNAPDTAVPETSMRGPAAPLGLSPPPAGNELRFDFHGYFRAPLRVGKNDRQGPVGDNQSATIFHEPLLLDDQSLNWNYTRAQEKAWAEMFFSYGNSRVTGTLGMTAYNFDDWERLSDAQFGIYQGWLTVNPDPGVDNLRLQWKVGTFSSRYGMAGKYDAGPYDTYLMGRTHQMGELFKADFDVAGGAVTLKAEHGFGAHGEEKAVGASGNAFTFPIMRTRAHRSSRWST